jgi:hypothetical protein
MLENLSDKVVINELVNRIRANHDKNIELLAAIDTVDGDFSLSEEIIRIDTLNHEMDIKLARLQRVNHPHDSDV